jgi:hypothetical protein
VEIPRDELNAPGDGVSILERSPGLDSSRYGFIIRADGGFVERKNAGWCGTPPISYANFQGHWSALTDTLLDITVGYWGGSMSYQMQIIRVNEEELHIRYLFPNDRAGAR